MPAKTAGSTGSGAASRGSSWGSAAGAVSRDEDDTKKMLRTLARTTMTHPANAKEMNGERVFADVETTTEAIEVGTSIAGSGGGGGAMTLRGYVFLMNMSSARAIS